MHLVEKLAIDAVSQGTHGLTVSLAIGTLGGCPGPSTGVGVALHSDVLRDSASRANSVDGGLIEVCYKR